MKSRLRRICVATAFILVSLLASIPAQAQVTPVSRGGTGTSTVPSYGQVLVGDGTGKYAPIATSSLGISASGFSTSSVAYWFSTQSTTGLAEGLNLYYTIARVQAALAAGYDAIFAKATTTSATSTNLAVTGSFNLLGTVITNVSTWFSGLFDTNFAAKLLTNLTFGGNVTVTGTSTLATTTTSSINKVVVVDGVNYPATGCGVKSAIAAAPTGSTVYVPSGTYSFASGCALSFGGKSIYLQGAGATSTKFVANGVGGGIIYDYYGTGKLGSERPGIEISGITFDVNNTSSLSAIQMGSSDDLSIHDIRVVRVSNIWGILIGHISGTLGAETQADYDASASNRVKFYRNEIASSTFGTNEGVLAVNWRDFDISGNSFHDITQGPASLALYVGTSRGTVSKNTFSSSTIKSFYSSGADTFTYSENIHTPASETVVSGAGIQIFNTRHANVVNNTFVGSNDGSSGAGGISIYDYKGNLDGHTTLLNATTSNIVIRNNTFRKAYTGVAMGQTSGTDKHYEKHDIHIEGNRFYDMLYKAVTIGTTANESTLSMSRIFIEGNREFGVNKHFSEGIYTVNGSSTAPSLVSAIVIRDNYATRSTAGGSSAGIYVDGASSVEIYNNHVSGTGKGSYSDIQIGPNTSGILRSQMATSTGFSFFNNVGIGTSSPYAALSVVGQIVASYFTGTSTATSTLAGGLNVTSGCLAVGGVCLGTPISYTATYPVTLTGTAIGLAFGTTSSNTWGGTQTFTNSPVLGSLTGLVKAASGVLSAAVAGVDYENPLTFTYPLTRAANAVSLAFGTSTANTWGSTQTFTNAPILGSLTGVLYGNNGTIAAKATSTASLGLALSGQITTTGTSDSLSIATSSLYSGAPGQLPYFSGTNTLTATSSLFMGTNGNVGIGSTSPAAILSVTGGNVSINTNQRLILDGSNSSATSISYDGSAIRFNRSSLQMRIDNGKVTIGADDISAAGRLNVAGKVNIGGTSNWIQGACVTDGLCVQGSIGIGTSSPYAQLSLGGGNLVLGAASAGGTPGDLYLPKLGTAAGSFLAVDATGKVIATTTPAGGGGGVSSVSGTYPVVSSGGATPAISLAFGTTTSNTWGGTQTFTNTPVLGSLTGLVKATAGALSAALVDLAADVTGTLPVGNGGTGSTTLSGLLKGNGTSAVQSAIAGTDYQAPISLTTTGTSGAATFIGNTLNIPQYSGGSGSVGSGTTGQFPYYAGAGTSLTATSSLFLDATSNVGIGGTTTPATTLSVAGSGYLTGGLGVGMLNTTAGTIDAVSAGDASALFIGRTGTTTPSFSVNNSAASSGNGLTLTTTAAGSGVTLGTVSANANEALTITAKGTGALTLGNSTAINLDLAASNSTGIRMVLAGSAVHTFTRQSVTLNATLANSTASTVRFGFTGAADTNLTAGTEAPSVYFNLAQTRQHANNAISLQRDFRIAPATHTFAAFNAGANTISTLAGVYLEYPQIGINAKATDQAALYIPTVAMTASTTRGVGLWVAAPTGATNNYAASTTGAWVMNALTSSATGNAVCISATNEILNAGGGTCTPSSIRFKENVKDMEPALEQLMKLHAVTYDYKEGVVEENERASMGFIAEEAVAVFPELADYGTDGQLFSIHWERLYAPIVKSIQELAANDDEQQRQIDELRAEIEALKAQQGIRPAYACLTHNP